MLTPRTVCGHSIQTLEALYSEIERLSGAWQILDEQNSAKVWNMASTEEKLQRLSVEVGYSAVGSLARRQQS
jgi:hypothetical protein